MKTLPSIAAILSLMTFAAAAKTVVLEHPHLAVAVDSEFPRIDGYFLGKDEVKTGLQLAGLTGQHTPVSTVLLNGKPAPCTVVFKKIAADAAEYRLAFPQQDIEVALRVSVAADGVELRVTEIRERGAAKMMSFAFPGNALLCLKSAQPDAAIAAVRASGYDQYRERIGPLSAMDPGSDTANYFFLSTGSLAAGIAGNHIDDCARVAVTITEANGVKTCAAQNPVWQYREIESETLPLPWVKVLVTRDRNGDGKADWQDAALMQRGLTPRPLGAEFVRTSVADQIAMNFASGAQQPFLRILDNVKKVSLITDGLGQSVLIKGFSAEGHDSANTDYGGHYNERAGGLTDLNFLLAQAAHFNARIGVHINATEVYPEAQRYKPEILQRDKNGNPVGGWVWLDHSHLIDKRKDLLAGNLFASLELMRKEMPRLNFVYVDVYGDRGWNAWKLAGKLNGMGLPIYTEYASVFDPWSVWAHQPGCKSRIFRFLWSGQRDLFRNPDPLLRGADHVGFMGWQGERDTAAFLRCTFGRNLPTKFLQHFPLLRWDADSAVFGEGVKVVKKGDAVTCTQGGRVVMTWTGTGANNRLFVPWSPVTQEKIYVWDEVGTEQSWELPPSWARRKEVFLYKLTDTGRAEETSLPVTAGRVTLKVAKNTPFVLYPAKAPARTIPVFGEGSPVKDPGFDSHGFAAWKPDPSGAGNIRMENDTLGNARLLIAGANGAAGRVTQIVRGLQPGKTYAASVWAQVKGERTASVMVQPQARGAATVSNYVARTSVRHKAPNDPRNGSNYQRLKVLFDTPPGCTAAKLTLSAAQGEADAEVEFDDVRMVETHRSPEAAQHWFWEDFENVDMGYGPFTCCPDEHTHLSEANPPYTKDTIHGKFSLKSREKNGLVLRTLPSTIRFKPNTRYRIACETLGQGRLVLVSGGARTELKFPEGGGRLAGEVATRSDTESYLALYKDGGDAIVIDDLALDEAGPAPVLPPVETAVLDEKLRGLRCSVQDNFAKPPAPEWVKHLSRHPGTALSTARDALIIQAGANVSAFVERDLPPDTVVVACVLNGDDDAGETWGPGLALHWADGKALRVNMRRPGGCFGIDSTAGPQKLAGALPAGDVHLRIRLETDKVFVEFRPEDGDWTEITSFPRSSFPGAPVTVRLGKTHGVEGVDDHSDPGPSGKACFKSFAAYVP